MNYHQIYLRKNKKNYKYFEINMKIKNKLVQESNNTQEDEN